MIISFRDALGICSVEVDDSGISFLDGVVYFSDADGDDYKISAVDLVEIVKVGG